MKKNNKIVMIIVLLLKVPERTVQIFIIMYMFVSKGEKEQYMIRVAMTEWEKYTCLRFRPSTRSDRNVLRFQNGQG